jgi:hypothetical protein
MQSIYGFPLGACCRCNCGCSGNFREGGGINQKLSGPDVYESKSSAKEVSCEIILLMTNMHLLVRFEVFTAVTIKNGVFWDVTQCGSCKNRRFGGT